MELTLSQWQKKVLESLLNQYENSKTYREKNKVTQTFSVSPAKVFPDYDSDFVDIDLVHDFEGQMKELEQSGLLVIIRKNGVMAKLMANPWRWGDVYKLLGKKSAGRKSRSRRNCMRNFWRLIRVWMLFAGGRLRG